MSLPPPDAEVSAIPQLHHALVDQLIKNGAISTAAVEAAFRAVARHLFLPHVPPEHVYQDQAIPTKYEDGRATSSSSQPSITAIMLEQLALTPGRRVLEIGAGTGYNAALMAHIVGDTGHVVTVDVEADLVTQAQEHLTTGGFSRVTVVQGDGAFGYPPGAPYDCIILTVGAWDIAPAKTHRRRFSRFHPRRRRRFTCLGFECSWRPERQGVPRVTRRGRSRRCYEPGANPEPRSRGTGRRSQRGGTRDP